MTDIRTQDTMREILERTTEELNKYNGNQAIVSAKQNDTSHDIGEDYARRYREAAGKTAMAIEAQANERLQIALAQVEEAKTHVENAQKIANDIMTGAEEEGRRAIENARRLQESIDTLV